MACAASFGVSGGRLAASGDTTPDGDQPLAVLIEIDQSEGRQQPFVVLLQAAVANLGVVEDALQDAEWPLHLRSNSRLSPVLSPLLLIHAVLCFRTAASHILRMRRGLVNLLCLSLIAAIAPDLFLVAVE